VSAVIFMRKYQTGLAKKLVVNTPGEWQSSGPLTEPAPLFQFALSGELSTSKVHVVGAVPVVTASIVKLFGAPLASKLARVVADTPAAVIAGQLYRELIAGPVIVL
jgi:hypothetical protein